MDTEVERPPRLLPPPLPPTDLIASALHLPLGKITTAHHRRKVRTTGQVIAFDIKSSLLLLAGPSTGAASSPLATLLVNINICLLGQSPAMKDLSGFAGGIFSAPPLPGPDDCAEGHWRSKGIISRERLRLDRGEWVSVVGWLEGEDERVFRKIQPGSSYAPPISIILEAIHIGPARPPQNDAMYRGLSEAWEGTITHSAAAVASLSAGNTVLSPIVIDDDDNETPRARRKR